MARGGLGVGALGAVGPGAEEGGIGARLTRGRGWAQLATRKTPTSASARSRARPNSRRAVERTRVPGGRAVCFTPRPASLGHLRRAGFDFLGSVGQALCGLA